MRPDVPHQSGIERVFAERQTLETVLQTQSEFWRQEVAQRVEKYRTRRSRKSLAGQFSMRLDFEASGTAAPAMDSLTITVSGRTQSFSPVPQTEEEPQRKRAFHLIFSIWPPTRPPPSPMLT